MNRPIEKLAERTPKRCRRAAQAIYLRVPKAKRDPAAGRLRVLLVEDSSHDELSIVNELYCGGFEVVHRRVETKEQFRAALGAEPWDLVLCDYCLNGFEAETLLQLHQRSGSDTPFIMVSATVGEDFAVDALKAGASDYVMKQNLSRLVPAIKHALRAGQERQIRRRTEATQSYLASVVESCNDAIIGETLDGTVVTWNGGAERLYGYSASEMIGRCVSVLLPWYRPESRHTTLEALQQGQQLDNMATVHLRKDGSEVEVSLSISPVKDAAGRMIGASTIARDITQWKREENERLSLIEDLTLALTGKNRATESSKAAG